MGAIERMVAQVKEQERLAKIAEQKTKELEAKETPQPTDRPS